MYKQEQDKAYKKLEPLFGRTNMAMRLKLFHLRHNVGLRPSEELLVEAREVVAAKKARNAAASGFFLASWDRKAGDAAEPTSLVAAADVDVEMKHAAPVAAADVEMADVAASAATDAGFRARGASEEVHAPASTIGGPSEYTTPISSPISSPVPGASPAADPGRAAFARVADAFLQAGEIQAAADNQAQGKGKGKARVDEDERERAADEKRRRWIEQYPPPASGWPATLARCSISHLIIADPEEKAEVPSAPRSYRAGR